MLQIVCSLVIRCFEGLKGNIKSANGNPMLVLIHGFPIVLIGTMLMFYLCITSVKKYNVSGL